MHLRKKASSRPTTIAPKSPNTMQITRTFSASRRGPIYRLIFNGKMAANSPRLAALAPKKAAWRPSGYRTSHVPSESWARTPTAALDLGCSITPPWHSAIATQISWTTSLDWLRNGQWIEKRKRSTSNWTLWPHGLMACPSRRTIICLCSGCTDRRTSLHLGTPTGIRPNTQISPNMMTT